MKGVFIVVCALIALCCWGFDDIDNDIDDRKFVSYDIHMKVNTETDFFVENQLSPLINTLIPHNEINFTRTIPHITLYMTMFERRFQDDIVIAFKETAVNLLHQYPNCTITMNHAGASGSYYLWHSNIPPCLQSMSNAFVESLSQFRDMNQTVPKWLDDIPEPQRSEMIKLQKLYGSPVVMSYFDPHITVAWDNQELMTPLDDITFPQFNITVSQFAVGLTTAHGAVLRNHDLIAFPPYV